jgi:trehalose 6-phosphate phosphatase
VHVPQPLLDVLQDLDKYLRGAVAVVSGRPIAQIDDFLEPLCLPVAGVHGMERRGADGRLHLLDAHPLDRVEAAARQLAAQHPGLLVEHKRGSLALHYRLAPDLEELCLRTLQQAVDASPGLALLRGKMVAEAKPARASKGHAIEDFLAEPPFAGRTPVFIGDDVTDEAGFSTVQSLGGTGIKVGPGDTVASRRLADPTALRGELEAALAARAAGTA